ncbi:ComEA family DNA-binding protein [Ekhidna sp.]|uniref:ComEA family DNA-binding protein n=1 Tax=Ekhidna sp. TaxID=2608089 RepID=UPI003CCB75B4
MLRFLINAISRSLGFTKTESRGTLVLIFIILTAILISNTRINHLKSQSTIVQDSSVLQWIKEVHASYEIRESQHVDDEAYEPVFKPKKYHRPKKFLSEITESPTEKLNTKVLDINTATAEELQRVKGIGPTYSERIIKYRDLLGGFADTTQLYEVYGLKEETIHRLLESFYVSNPIHSIDINADSVSLLARHPYISYDLARVIINYRKEHGDIQRVEELIKIKAIDERTFRRLKPYLE